MNAPTNTVDLSAPADTTAQALVEGTAPDFVVAAATEASPTIDLNPGAAMASPVGNDTSVTTTEKSQVSEQGRSPESQPTAAAPSDSKPKRTVNRTKKIKGFSDLFRIEPEQSQVAINAKSKAFVLFIPSNTPMGTDDESSQIRAILPQLKEIAGIGAVKQYGIKENVWEILLSLPNDPTVSDENLLKRTADALKPFTADCNVFRNGFNASKRPHWAFTVSDITVSDGEF